MSPYPVLSFVEHTLWPNACIIVRSFTFQTIMTCPYMNVDNPVDCASLGLMPDQLPMDHIWWASPQWLSQPCSTWFKQPCSDTQLETLPNLKFSSMAVMVVTQDEPGVKMFQ
ncbi:hypothetical protein PR048_007109 [Dryococelus australis]|uniref:Uncharacterized protein n=1 Tax=Dryococelus australis TaxID=614101 RepID=A0ABQ9ICQ1_9NEOP|nr:hypothetical protein PR048_007109 [Dryococelus australis]